MTSDSSDYESVLKYEIFDQNKVVSLQIIDILQSRALTWSQVTYRLLSRKLGVNVNKAKEYDLIIYLYLINVDIDAFGLDIFICSRANL